jgi:hypothetical protein
MKVPKPKTPLLKGVAEYLKKQPFNHAEHGYATGQISRELRDAIISGKRYEETQHLFDAMRKAILDTPPGGMNKIGKSLELQKLIEAKKRSDVNDYAGKNRILAELLNKHPKQFKVDSDLNQQYVGITHKPSGFRIHTQRKLIPTGIEKMSEKERVRVVLPYNGKFLLERLANPAWPKNYGKKRHIGGGIEAGETPEQAASREMNEELGIKVDPSHFKYLGKHEGQHYIELPQSKHDLKPGSYKATVGSDPFIHLEHTHPHGDDYMGPAMHLFGNK